jgi:hypothetical protein
MRLLTGVACLLIGAGTAVAKECRMPEVPPGVRTQLPPGCQEPTRAGQPQVKQRDHVRADAGFVDLGNGTKVRIGGRVRAEVGVRR